MPVMNVRIVAFDLNTRSVRVFAGDVEIKGITKIEVEPILPGSVIRAKIELLVDKLDLEAERVE